MEWNTGNEFIHIFYDYLNKKIDCFFRTKKGMMK